MVRTPRHASEFDSDSDVPAPPHGYTILTRGYFFHDTRRIGHHDPITLQTAERARAPKMLFDAHRCWTGQLVWADLARNER